jgi:ElaB/YqjD/DUF883 family membrane-anchored ribosome-binding protein
MTFMQDGKPLKMPVPADLDALMAQLQAQLQTLRDDVTRLGNSATDAAESRGRKMASDISDGVTQAVRYVERKGVGAEAELEKSLASHPLMALGLAAGIGLVIGAMTRR